jgi:hypothetical protein
MHVQPAVQPLLRGQIRDALGTDDIPALVRDEDTARWRQPLCRQPDKQIIEGIPAHAFEIVGRKADDRAHKVTPSPMYFTVGVLFDKTRNVSLH